MHWKAQIAVLGLLAPPGGAVKNFDLTSVLIPGMLMCIMVKMVGIDIYIFCISCSSSWNMLAYNMVYVLTG